MQGSANGLRSLVLEFQRRKALADLGAQEWEDEEEAMGRIRQTCALRCGGRARVRRTRQSASAHAHGAGVMRGLGPAVRRRTRVCASAQRLRRMCTGLYDAGHVCAGRGVSAVCVCCPERGSCAGRIVGQMIAECRHRAVQVVVPCAWVRGL